MGVKAVNYRRKEDKEAVRTQRRSNLVKHININEDQVVHTETKRPARAIMIVHKKHKETGLTQVWVTTQVTMMLKFVIP